MIKIGIIGVGTVGAKCCKYFTEKMKISLVQELELKLFQLLGVVQKHHLKNREDCSLNYQDLT